MNQHKLTEQRVALGWREWVSLPDINLPWIIAKVDSGARTSALHAFSIEPFERDGQEWVRFGMHPRRKDTSVETFCEAPISDMRDVTDSGGHTEKRYVIKTRLIAGHIEKDVEITLTNRDSMSYRMLLGRTAMNKHFMVIPDQSFLLGTPNENELSNSQQESS